MKYQTEAGNKRRALERQEARTKALQALALGGGAYGSYRLGEWFLPRESRHRLKMLNDTIFNLQRRQALAPESLDPKEVIKAYANQASGLANTPVGAWKGKDLVKFIRTSLPVSNKWHPHFSDAHYDAFARGPAFGAMQLIDEHNHEMWHQLGNEKGKGLGPDFTQEYASRLKDLSKRLIGRDVTKGMSSLREGLAYQGQGIAPDDQQKILNGLLYDPSMNRGPGFLGMHWPDSFKARYGELQKTLANGLLGSSFPNYQRIGNIADNIRKGLSLYTPALLGAGAATAGGLGLYHLLKGMSRTDYEKRKQQQEVEDLENDRFPMNKTAYADYSHHNVQSMMPLRARRQLDEAEQQKVDAAKQQWIPKIFQNLSDDPSVQFADPKKQALLWGVGTGLPTALLASAASGSDPKSSLLENAAAGAATGLGVGGFTALLAYLARRQKNADIEENMRRLPEGATLRDYQADPLVSERRRYEQMRALAAMQQQPRFF